MFCLEGRRSGFHEYAPGLGSSVAWLLDQKTKYPKINYPTYQLLLVFIICGTIAIDNLRHDFKIGYLGLDCYLIFLIDIKRSGGAPLRHFLL